MVRCDSVWRAYHLDELSATAALTAAAFLVNLIPLRSIPFIERDPTISYAYVPSTVSTAVLVVISAGIPIVFILAASVVWACACKRDSEPLSRHVLHCLWVLLALAQALLATKFVTDAIKIGVAHARPNMLAYCDYAGLYRAAAAERNFTAYWAVTEAGAFGDVSRCAASAAEIKDAQSSFPSGHSSSSAAGMLFLTLYARAVAGVRRGVFFTWLAMLTAAPLAVAIFVAATRVHDRYHATSACLHSLCTSALIYTQ